MFIFGSAQNYTFLTVKPYNLLTLALEEGSVWCVGLDCKIVVSEVKLQPNYYVHFRANTIGKGMDSLIHPS